MLHVNTVSKSFGSLTALNSVSMNVSKGTIYGLLGPNGAGKSTLINIISGLTLSDSGSVTIKGLDVNKDRIQCKKILGVVPQEIALYEELSGIDNLLFWGKLYGNHNNLKSKCLELLELTGLQERANDKVKNYSGGMKRRINIAAALLHNPELILMDEPTVGIDPQSRNLIFEIILHLQQNGATIIYTTHYMEEAEKLCNTIGIIDKGKIICEGSLDNLIRTSGLHEQLYIEYTGELSSNMLNEQFGSNMVVSGNTITINSEQVKNDLSKLIFHIKEQQAELTQIKIKHPNLESIFLNLTGKNLRD